MIRRYLITVCSCCGESCGCFGPYSTEKERLDFARANPESVAEDDHHPQSCLALDIDESGKPTVRTLVEFDGTAHDAPLSIHKGVADG
jgi:hypothetical protein